LRTFAHETAGAASTRHSLRPLFFGRMILQTSGAARRENAEAYSVVIVRLVRNCALGRTIQYPEAPMIEPIGRGVLDTLGSRDKCNTC